MRNALFGLFVLVILTSCSPNKDLPIAEAGVAAFHQKLDSGDFDSIYDDSSDAMKAATTQQNLVLLLSAIHRKLGNFQSGKSVGWNDMVATSGHTITLNYAATYDGGTADENFVFRIEDGKAVLSGYHINSMALIVN